MIAYLPAVAFALLLVGAVHWYLWRRLVADVSRRGSWWRRIGTALTVLLALLVPATLVGARVLAPHGGGRLLAWPGYLWIALLFYLLLTLGVLEIPRAVGRRMLRRRRVGPPPEPMPTPAPVPDEAWRRGGALPEAGTAERAEPPAPAPPADTGTPIDPTRRRLLARSLALVAGAAAGSTVGYGTWSQMRGPVVEQVAVPLSRLDPQIDGFRIAVLSDLHLGPILDHDFAERVVATVNDQSPDLITIVGDLVDGSVSQLRHAVQPLRRLSAPHGAYFVTGNHEYYSGVEQWVQEVRELGIHPLRNQHTEIIGGRTAAFDLAGVNDATGGDYSPGEAPNYAAALRGRDPHRPVVLLAHQPVQVHEAAGRGVDLQLSGHTHGGQLWPLHYAVRLQQPVVAGLARYERTWLYVTRGAGSWGPPVRVGAPPDITVVTLRSTR